MKITKSTNKESSVEKKSPALQREPDKSGPELDNSNEGFKGIFYRTSPRTPPEAFASVLARPEFSRRANTPQRIAVINHLQRTYGNRYVQRVLQAKLKIGQPGDIYEQEADRVAEQVMKMAVPPVQRQPVEEEEEKKEEELVQTKPIAEQITPLIQRQPEEEEKKEEELQAKETTSQPDGVISGFESRINSMKGNGRLLPESERAYFEPRFGQGFSNVRLHADSSAAHAAEAVGAKAFTVGNDVVFGATQYRPGTSVGRRLLAHELTHVVQQSNSNISGKSKVSKLANSFEWRAGETNDAVTSGTRVNNIAAEKQLNKNDRGITPVRTVPIIQMQEPISTVTIFGITMALGDALTVAGLMVGVGLGVTGSMMAYSGMGKTGTGTALTLPEKGDLFLVGQSGKDIIAGLIRVLVYQDTKTIGEKSAANKKGSKKAKLAAAKEAMEKDKDKVISNVTTRIKNKMQSLLPKKPRSEEFVWNEENGWTKEPTWGSVTIRVRGAHLDPWMNFWVKTNDYEEAGVEIPAGTFRGGVEYFQTIEMSATCDDTTTGAFDDLMVIPEKLDIKDETKGGLCGIGEAGFGWDETTTRMRWDEKKSIKHNITYFPHYKGTPED